MLILKHYLTDNQKPKEKTTIIQEHPMSYGFLVKTPDDVLIKKY